MKNEQVILAEIFLGDGEYRGNGSASSAYSAGPRPSAMVGVGPAPKPAASTVETEKEFWARAAIARAQAKERKDHPLLFCTCGGAYPHEYVQRKLGVNDCVNITMGTDVASFMNAGAKAFDNFGNEWTIVEKAKPASLSVEPSPETRPTTIPEPKKERRLVPREEAIDHMKASPGNSFAWSFTGTKYTWCAGCDRLEFFAAYRNAWEKAGHIVDFLYLDPPETA